MINSAIFFFFLFLSRTSGIWMLVVLSWFFVCFCSIILLIIWRNPHLYFFFLFISLVLSCFSFPGTLFYFLNLPFIPPCSCFIDVISVLIFAWCKNHIIYVSFPYVDSASSNSLVCLSWSLSSIVEPFLRCLANPVG